MVGEFGVHGCFLLVAFHARTELDGVDEMAWCLSLSQVEDEQQSAGERFTAASASASAFACAFASASTSASASLDLLCRVSYSYATT